MNELTLTVAPTVKRVPRELIVHDHTRMDKYFWLNDRNDPEVIEYLQQENDYLKEQLKHTEGFQSKLFDEMKARIREDDESVPYLKNGFYYYTKFLKGGEYPVFCRKEGSLDEEEEVMLDVNLLADGREFMSVGAVVVAPDQNLLAFSEDMVGRRIYDIRFKDLKTGELLDDVIHSVTGNLVWANDSETIFYSRQDSDTLRAFQIYRHTLGTDQKEDVLVYQEDDDTFTCYVSKSKSRDYIFIHSQSTLSSEYRFLSAENPEGNWKLVQQRTSELEYSVEHYGDEFLILTNDKEAKNFKLVKAPVVAPGKENWIDLIPHQEDVLIEGFEVFRDFLVIDERYQGLNRINIRSWDGVGSHDIVFEEPAYAVWIGHNPEFDSQVLRFGYNSLTTPGSIYDYDMNSHHRVLLKQHEVVGGYNADEYQSERIWATAGDGVKIPISLVYKKELFRKDGSNPLLQYGYGSYGHSIDAVFSSGRLSLLDRGVVFAIAHIRGGQELGRAWYEEGKLLKKKNSFTDFIACSEYLIEQQYCSKETLYAMGGSAGGLLIGAVMNLRPDLYKGMIAAVPFVDVATTMLDETIPLTTGEFDEWGNPKNKVYYDYILSYSPYDNIERKDYPHLLVTSGLHDSQVQYWEPTKWVAKLRELKTDDRRLLLYTNMEAGHGGASGRFKPLKETALEYAFILDLAEKTN